MHTISILIMLDEQRKQILEDRKKVLTDQLKIIDLYPEDTIKYFGSQKEILRRIDEILDEIIEIERFLKTK